MSEVDRIRDYFGSARWRSSRGRAYLAEERRGLLHDVVGDLGLPFADIAVCDIGCGTGTDLIQWRDSGVRESQLAGTELIAGRAEFARKALPAADIRLVEGFDLPFPSGGFDVCSAALVFSSVLPEAWRRRLISEMARVTRPGGVVIVYDFVIRKPWNRNVTAVSSRQLRRLWRPADHRRPAAPFLPALDLALQLPPQVRGPLIAALPRTHRMWVWRIGPPIDKDEGVGT